MKEETAKGSLAENEIRVLPFSCWMGIATKRGRRASPPLHNRAASQSWQAQNRAFSRVADPAPVPCFGMSMQACWVQ